MLMIEETEEYLLVYLVFDRIKLRQHWIIKHFSVQ